MILHYELVSITTSVASQSLMLMLWSKHNFWASLDPILATKTLVCPDDDATMSLAECSLVSIPPVTSCEEVDIFILSAIWPSDVRRISWRRFAPETKSEKFNKHVCFAWFSSDLPLKQRNNLIRMSVAQLSSDLPLKQRNNLIRMSVAQLSSDLPLKQRNNLIRMSVAQLSSDLPLKQRNNLIRMSIAQLSSDLPLKQRNNLIRMSIAQLSSDLPLKQMWSVQIAVAWVSSWTMKWIITSSSTRHNPLNIYPCTSRAQWLREYWACMLTELGAGGSDLCFHLVLQVLWFTDTLPDSSTMITAHLIEGWECESGSWVKGAYGLMLCNANSTEEEWNRAVITLYLSECRIFIVCVMWHGAWLYGVHRMRQDGSSFTWHQPCNNQTVM